MNIKRLDRDKWGFQGFPYYQFRMDKELFHGLVCIINIVDGEYFYWNMPRAGKVAVTGKGMTWLQLIPDGQHRVITAKFLPNKQISVWYVDVIEETGFAADGVATFTDKYLDVIFSPKKDIKIDDRDELDAAYASGELSEKQYNDAITEGDCIVEELCKDIKATEKWCRRILDYSEELISNGLKPFKRVDAVFLDMDGVMDVFNPTLTTQEILPSALECLQKITAKNNCRIVLISTWRFCTPRFRNRFNSEEDKNQMETQWTNLVESFSKYDLKIADSTDWDKSLKTRSAEILAYLKNHPEVESYVILDDCFHDTYDSSPALQKHLVFVDALKGLQEKDVESALKTLS